MSVRPETDPGTCAGAGTGAGAGAGAGAGTASLQPDASPTLDTTHALVGTHDTPGDGAAGLSDPSAGRRTERSPRFRIRRAVSDDAAALKWVCLATGDSGSDGTHLYKDDPDALGRLYTQPYLTLQPDFAWVLEDAEGVCGYTLGTPSTVAFAHKYNTSYQPELCSAFPKLEEPKTPADRVHACYHEPFQQAAAGILELYPAHLHIDIVARAQRRGQGTKLIHTMLAAMREAGVPGVHLCMAPKNVRAYRFYKALGFVELQRLPDDLYLGLRLKPLQLSGCGSRSVGVIEGFYGRPWSLPQRLTLFQRMHTWGLNMFMYGPKDDRKVRADWRSLYLSSELEGIEEQVRACAARNVEFMYAIAPGLDISHSSTVDVACLNNKLDQLVAIGVRSFVLLFDDIPDKLSDTDTTAFVSLAEAQCAVANSVFLRLHHLLEGSGRFVFCPTEYCSALCNPSLEESAYVTTVGQELIHIATVFWTGPAIVSEVVTTSHAAMVRRRFCRKFVFWDNLHANDYDNGRRLYLGPVQGRDAGVFGHTAGFMTNPNCEFEANFVCLRTLSLFCQDATGYDPRKAFVRATAEWADCFNKGLPADDARTFSPTDVQRLADLYYLPWGMGEFGSTFVAAAKRAIAGHDVTAFVAMCDAIIAIFSKLTELLNRGLVYSLYRFLWDAKEEADLLKEFVIHSAKNPGEAYRSAFYKPGTYRGGFMATTQQLLTMTADGAFRCAFDERPRSARGPGGV